MVETIVAAPDIVIRGDTADEYDAQVGSWKVRVVAHREPPTRHYRVLDPQ